MPGKGQKQALTIGLFVIAAVALYYFIFKFRKETTVKYKYNLKDVRLFRSQFTDISKDKSTLNTTTGANIDMATFPLLDGTDKVVGTVEATASIYEHSDDTADVIQNLMYILPGGSVFARLHFKNTTKSIFPEVASYKVPIVSGTGDYANKSGSILIDVKEDGTRNLTITYK